MAVVLINPFVIAPEAESAFLHSWRATADVFASQPGYIDTRLHRAIDRSARFQFINIAHWTSAEAWRAAMKSSPPREGGTAGIEANPALYSPAEGGTIEARNGAVTQDVTGLESSIARAYQANDAEALDRIMADDYVVTDGPGTVTSKAKLLEDVGQRKLLVTSFTFDEMDVRTVGPDAALVLGQYTWDASYAGHAIPARTFRYMRAYARVDDGWRVKAGQVTPVLAAQ